MKEEEHDWEAECDARTLAEADMIRGDEKRHSKAQEAAKHLAEEERERAEAMERTAKGKMVIGYERSPSPPKKY